MARVETQVHHVAVGEDVEAGRAQRPTLAPALELVVDVADRPVVAEDAPAALHVDRTVEALHLVGARVRRPALAVLLVRIGARTPHSAPTPFVQTAMSKQSKQQNNTRPPFIFLETKRVAATLVSTTLHRWRYGAAAHPPPRPRHRNPKRTKRKLVPTQQQQQQHTHTHTHKKE